ncbi:YckD family protein [Desulfosporosinus sp.]|uniref:YckD family protein n=1 Tax=Desulfosporosinus sp. TaxID=157907 RepID=UPI00261FE7B1|nr:YckD family protein [Desulfosporosinus sp.]
MKRRLLVILTLVFALALAAAPAYAAITDQQKADIDALNKQISEIRKQIVDKYAEAGETTKAQADATKDNIDASEQYRQQFSQQQGQIPTPGYAPGYGYGHGCGPGWGGGGYYGGMW